MRNSSGCEKKNSDVLEKVGVRHAVDYAVIDHEPVFGVVYADVEVPDAARELVGERKILSGGDITHLVVAAAVVRARDGNGCHRGVVGYVAHPILELVGGLRRVADDDFVAVDYDGREHHDEQNYERKERKEHDDEDLLDLFEFFLFSDL